MKLKFCYLQKNREKIINFAHRFRSIYLYGTGAVAECFYKYLVEEQIAISGVIVTIPSKKEPLFHNIKVFTINEVAPVDDMGIILAMKKTYQAEVLPSLLAKGFVEEQLYKQEEFYVHCGAYQTKIRKEFLLDNANGIALDGYFAKYTLLNNIGIKYSTDKASTFHDYLCKYEHFLHGKKVVKLLELGVFEGASLKMWSEYFPQGKIYGVDIMPKCKKFADESKKIIIKDLSDENALETLTNIKPDVIVDDASHVWSHQIKALFVLFSSLLPGGLYILEDLETSFRAYSNTAFVDSDLSTYEVLEALNEIVTSGEKFYLGRKNPLLLNYKDILESMALHIDMISFIHGSCIIIKKGN